MKIFIFVGIILLSVGIYLALSGGSVSVNKQKVSGEKAQTIKYAVGGGVGGLGVLFIVIGAVSMVRASKQKKRNEFILQNGKDTQANVTFVDRNWSFKVNGQPIYSIVEYVYKDNLGQQHTRRISNLRSEYVIRQKIEVGSTISIRYLPENPKESVMLING